jgi:hypothetical protein
MDELTPLVETLIGLIFSLHVLSAAIWVASKSNVGISFSALEHA